MCSNKGKDVFNILRDINRGHRTVLLSGIADSITSTMKTYLPLFLFAPFLQAVVNKNAREVMVTGVIYFLSILLCGIASQWVQGKRIIAARKMNESAVDSLYQKISRLKYKDFQSGETTMKYQNALEVLYYEFDYSDLIDCEVSLFSNVLHIVFSLSMTFALIFTKPVSGSGVQFMLARVDLSLLGFFVLLALLILIEVKTAKGAAAKQAELLREHGNTEQKLMCLQNDIIYEFQNYLTYHLFHMKELLSLRFQENTKNNTRFFSNVRRLSLYKKTLSSISAGAAVVYSYALTVIKFLAGAIPISMIATYAQSMIKMQEAVIEAISSYGKISRAIPYINSISEVMGMEEEIGKEEIEKGNRIRTPLQVDCIEFEHVYYRYPNSREYALEDVHFTLKRGRHVFVGENGSGKTTLLLLLCRILEPEKGRILLNGTDIREYDICSYRQLFSYIFQDSGLYPIPLGENVAFDLNYDMTAVQEAMRKAEASESLCSEENLTETSTKRSFSGGEQQKIAAARALYHDTDVLVCDEPTAAMDAVSENRFYHMLKQMQKEHFIIFVSHRMSSCQDCEDIIVFQNGTIVERGEHAALRAQGGIYEKLWSAQAQYYQ